jgi:thymidylate synthase
MSDGSIPVLVARGRSLAEMWENSLLELHSSGARARTQYDRKGDDGGYIDPPSIDATMLMVCEEPASDPMIHRAFPGGLEDLEEYRLEVVDGVKNHWVRDPSDSNDERWEYTYNGRLTAHPAARVDYSTGKVSIEEFNQFDYMVERVSQSPFTRRAIAHTWVVGEDNFYESPPCLQGLWIRALPNDDDGLTLNMDVRFRSRDAYDAAFMNCFAFLHLMKEFAARIAGKTGKEVKLGRYADFSDSYHIYGRRITDFEERFLKLHETRPFEDRTWPLEFAQPIFDEARPRILEKIKSKDAGDEAEKTHQR